MPYEIEILLVRGTDDGLKYKGAHVIERAGDLARALRPEDVPAILTGLNAAALARVDELEAELAELKSASKAVSEEAAAEKAETLAHLAAAESATHAGDKGAAVAALELAKAGGKERMAAKLKAEKSRLEAELAAVNEKLP